MRATLLVLAALAGPAQAAWTWSEALTANSVQGAKIFPHLESANRQGVAVSGDTVGVVWEDNRNGSPQCYLAIKPAVAKKFRPEIRLSQTECYEPVVVALGAGRFVAAWEEAGRVQAQIVPGGAVLKLTEFVALPGFRSSRAASVADIASVHRARLAAASRDTPTATSVQA